MASIKKLISSFFDEEETASEIKVIPTGLDLLDEIIGGGIPTPSIVEIFGSESTGKTALAINLAGRYQANNKKGVLFIDAEKTFNTKFANLLGLDTDKNFKYIKNSELEKIFEFLKALAKDNNEIGFVIIDSLASLIPQEELATDFTKETQMALKAKKLARVLRNLVALNKDMIIVIINHIIDNPNSMYAGKTTPGGRALKFYSSLRLQTKLSAKSKDGLHINVYVAKNKTAQPFKETTLKLDFNSGFDEAFNYYEYLNASGDIVRGRGEIDGTKFFGYEAFKKLFSQPQYKKAIIKLVSEKKKKGGKK